MYKELEKLSHRELDEHVRTMVNRLQVDESHVIARMMIRQFTFSLN